MISEQWTSSGFHRVSSPCLERDQQPNHHHKSIKAPMKTWDTTSYVGTWMVFDLPANMNQSDYRDIHEQYGTMDDVDNLIAELKNRDMKLVMDLVVNHTSNKV